MVDYLNTAAPSDKLLQTLQGFAFEQIELTQGINCITSANAYEVIFNSGAGVRFVPENGHASVACNTGSIVFILSPYSTKEFTIQEPGNFFRLYIDREFLASWFGSERLDFVTDANVSSEFLAQCMTALFSEATKPQIIEKRYITSIAMVVVNELYCQFRASGKKCFSPKGKLSPQQMKKVIDFVKSSLHAEIHLSAMANEVHLSDFHFSRLFRNTFGISPYQYVLQVKVEYAKTLLRHYPRSLSQIAHSLNFTDQSHFTNVFKKLTGICPSDFAMNRVKSVA
jgi:AraC family transcriptional regulator